MAGNYSALKQTIDSNIKQNGAQQITGPVLNSVLNQIVSSIGANATFAGIATPDTNPGTPDQNVFYLASVPGEYTNFGNGITLTADSLGVLYLYENVWTLKKFSIPYISLALGGMGISKAEELSVQSTYADYYINVQSHTTAHTVYPGWALASYEIPASGLYLINVPDFAENSLVWCLKDQNSVTSGSTLQYSDERSNDYLNYVNKDFTANCQSSGYLFVLYKEGGDTPTVSRYTQEYKGISQESEDNYNKTAEYLDVNFNKRTVNPVSTYDNYYINIQSGDIAHTENSGWTLKSYLINHPGKYRVHVNEIQENTRMWCLKSSDSISNEDLLQIGPDANDYDNTYDDDLYIPFKSNVYILVAYKTGTTAPSVTWIGSYVDIPDSSKANIELLSEALFSKQYIKSDASLDGVYLNMTTNNVSLMDGYKVVSYPVKRGCSYIISVSELINSVLIWGFAQIKQPANGISVINPGLRSNEFLDGPQFFICTSELDGYLYVTIPSPNTPDPIVMELTPNGVMNNQWRGKKIVWLGTSVPFGQYATTSYAWIASQILGFELIQTSLPGEAIHANKSDNNYIPLTYGSTCLTKDEYSAAGWQIPSSPIDYIPGGSYNNYYRTYENIFVEDNADADLYVFDVAPNNTNFSLDDWNAFNYDEWKYNDSSSFSEHRGTFLGALLFLMDQMYSLNPNARMVLILGSSFGYAAAKSNLDLVKEKWNIPIIDIWSKVNISPKSITKINTSGSNLHPSDFGHEVLGKMLVNEMLLIA